MPAKLVHGHAKPKSPTYLAWQNMRKRCENPRHESFENYGARGIAVCREWQASFEAFLADVGEKPSPKHSIDRINNDGNYEPGNCRWATQEEQHRNQRPKRKKNLWAPLSAKQIRNAKKRFAASAPP